MLDLVSELKRLLALSLVLVCLFEFGCKSPAHQAEDQAAAKKAKSQATGDAAASAADRGRGTTGSNYERSTSRKSDEPTREDDTQQGYEGGDPRLFHPPVHSGPEHEKIETKSASTPTPTPNRPIDRPLDPSGHVIPGTPEG